MLDFSEITSSCGDTSCQVSITEEEVVMDTIEPPIACPIAAPSTQHQQQSSSEPLRHFVHDIALNWLEKHGIHIPDAAEKLFLGQSDQDECSLDVEHFLKGVARWIHDAGIFPSITDSYVALFSRFSHEEVRSLLKKSSSTRVDRKRKVVKFVDEHKDRPKTESTQIIEEHIADFIEQKRRKIDSSNQKEYLGADGSTGSARTTSPNPELNRRIQMRLDVVQNDHGPLSRSNSQVAGEQSLDSDTIELKTNAAVHDIIDERLQVLEKHLLLESSADTDTSSQQNSTKKWLDRIRTLEDRLLALEETQTKYIHYAKQGIAMDPQIAKGVNAKHLADVKVLRAANASANGENDQFRKEQQDIDERIRILRAKLRNHHRQEETKVEEAPAVTESAELKHANVEAGH